MQPKTEKNLTIHRFYPVIFIGTVVLAFAIALGVSIFFALPRIGSGISDMQETVSQNETDLTGAFIERFISDRFSVLRDIANYPIVKNGVMGAGINESDLSDFLRDVSIMGKYEDLAILTFAGGAVYQRASGSFMAYDVDSKWFKRIIAGESKQELNLFVQGDKNYFQLAIPIYYGDFVEGVLVSEVAANIDETLQLFAARDNRGVVLKKDGVVIRSSNSGKIKDALVISKTLPEFNLQMDYVIDTALVSEEKNAFLFLVSTSIVTTMGMMLAVLLLSGNVTIIAPYRRLLELTKERNEARVAAESSARAKSDFLASMSHEIRTPMNGVLGMIGLLLKEPLTEKQRHKATTAQSSAKSLLTLINDILDFSKIEAGKLELERLDFDPKEFLEEFADTMALPVQQKGLELVLDVTDIDQSAVKGDPSRLRQILTNIVGNAIKFTDKGEIMIRAGLVPAGEQQKFYCIISDTGIGIPEEKLSHLFEEFTQADASTTRRYGGTGLGLSIAKKLCELMGGSISADSSVGRGTRFEFTLTFETSEHAVEIPAGADLAGQNILVVDDNKTNREVVVAQLTRWGASVTQAEDGASALEVVQRRAENPSLPQFHVAFLDMQMPGMDGVTLGKYIKADEKNQDLKLVLMAPLSEHRDKEYFAGLGFATYFPKPARDIDLVKALEAAERGEQAVVQEEHGNLAHDESHMQVEATENDLSQYARLLLVEDNPVNQMVALGVLQEMGLQADVAVNGRDAIDALVKLSADDGYSLILMDCQMPEMDGHEATRRIREGEAGARFQSIPIIAMTANAMKGDKEKCLDSGMDDYLSKPVEPAVLQSVLFGWLKKNGQPLSMSDPEPSIKVIEVSAPVSKSASVVWDRESALARVHGKEERLMTLVELFLQDAEKNSDVLRQAIADRDMTVARERAHSIKGSAANISALGVQNIARQMEQAARDEDAVELAEQWDLFKEQWHLLCDELRRYSVVHHRESS